MPARGHYVFIMHCNTAPFDNNDLRMALKLAIDREEMLDKILRGYGSLGNDFPINASYPLFSDDIEQRKFDPDKAKFHYKKSGHDGPVLLRTSDVAFPGAVDAAQLYQQSAAKAGITHRGQARAGRRLLVAKSGTSSPSRASYWGGRPTQDQMYSTAYHSKADWNDTRFLRQDFDKMLLAARAELDEAKRKADLPRHGDDGARRRRPDPADVQPVHRRDRRQGRRLGRRSASGADERLRAGEVLARSLSPALRMMSSPIVKLVAQRIALGILLLLAVSVLIFAGTQILPGDVAQSILGQSATPEALANLREELGLNDPAYVRYFRWLGGVAAPAISARRCRAARTSPTSIGGRLWNTLFLAFWAAVVAVPLAIILGLLAVRYRNGWVDKLISGLALASTSLPEFFIGYLLVYFFAVKLQMVPRHLDRL